MGAEESASSIGETHADAHEDVATISDWGAWIGGVSLRGDSTFTTRDPVVDENIVSVTKCGLAQLDDAVDAAWDAYESSWSEYTPTERGALLFEWAERLADHTDELAFLESIDTGKPISHARVEVEGAIDTLQYYASIARDQTGKQIQARDDVHLFTRKEPYGVVGQIVPWNFPTWGAAWKFGPALAAGNATVLKPSRDSPLTAIRMAELSEGIFPDGVINVVTGGGSDVGDYLINHEEINKLSFTGSTGIGKHVMRSAADDVTPVTLELGGKSPFIVFPDADLDTVVEAVASGIFYATGEICDAFARAIVHEDIHEEFTERFIERAESYEIGDPLDEATTLGPLTSESQYDQVTEYIEIGKEEATLLTGGSPPAAKSLSDGWFIEPTVFGDVENDMQIAQEEIFGPVETIIPFSTYEEAIEIANDTRFGLAAGIGTERTDIVHTAAKDIESGLIYVNEYGPILPEAPYGGYKRSGIGKDLGREALDHYRRTKSVYVNIGEPNL